ncbi:hypothetical protein F3Y22_tig00000003pilonHSYRG00141 [Hibiscus syriacus]|uniref:AtC3H23-like CCCH zinc finger domain-containing protein n=1 Tax=Hibiscus syriacus TaxID=106335 RepID=A0A6A3DAI5_HIBSY|nr:hypothetical protein F3Y22_tig00000003pilonHSYRG00141 [Hibiscus syriacus]
MGVLVVEGRGGQVELHRRQKGDDPYGDDHFRMYEFKVRKYTTSRSHDWTDCPSFILERRHAVATRDDTVTPPPFAPTFAEAADGLAGTTASSLTWCLSVCSTLHVTEPKLTKMERTVSVRFSFSLTLHVSVVSCRIRHCRSTKMKNIILDSSLAGSLSKAEAPGLTLSSIEKLSIFSKAEELGLLSLLEKGHHCLSFKL